jgi:hypothetical protein
VRSRRPGDARQRRERKGQREQDQGHDGRQGVPHGEDLDGGETRTAVVGKRPTYEVSDPARARNKTVFTESARGLNSRQVKSVRVVRSSAHVPANDDRQFALNVLRWLTRAL